MNNEKLEQIRSTAVENLSVHMDEMEDQILEAINVATEQAQEEDKESVKVKLPYTIAFDLGKGTLETKLAVSVKHTTKHVARLDDGQLALPLE